MTSKYCLNTVLNDILVVVVFLKSILQIISVNIFLKGQCHEDFAVLGQFCAKIITFRL